MIHVFNDFQRQSMLGMLRSFRHVLLPFKLRFGHASMTLLLLSNDFQLLIVLILMSLDDAHV